MTQTHGSNFWASDEGVAVLDTAHAAGQGRVARDREKVNSYSLLGVQNGFAFRGTSNKGQTKLSFHVPVTNFGFFHAAQPKAIHNDWGHVFDPDSPHI